MARTGRPRKGESPLIEPEVILERSAWLFARKGYHATSMLDIAQALDVTRGAIYYYYLNKGAILAALYKRGGEAFHAAWSPTPDATPEDALWELMFGYAKAVLEYRNLFTVISTEHVELRDDPEAARERATWRQRFENAYIAANPTQAAAAPETIVDTAAFLMGAPVALLFWSEAPEDHDYIERARLVADLAVHGVLHPR
jgi:AcrR family transcriptional regulator